ncbi:sodium-dependent multivitamin transporter-like isoform X2 [Mizuhopecten yessoensis]|uniref:Sodium-dependent multivitamin transporter n=2 Tax=Mizuhopecten yessoensis TaxID=6573 RepID=A0A210PXG4_MIZYE|nr:sodium-dependent multivitamin transporter-like isoform X2 [Mizuhopecten yessoensis]XP_021372734.1 sodium-dependent multivitamin transporter-like isoform X2 [Mizuhopecten yessoensis]XP_021372735.1 sodium-dependent multivitamin transporter-like isoform X2 [Mizuhopecten yessoensis]XP_021372736.1 sodium-dependent multivitamin transporter-like isoform X2 [Mizuhopecten yessoensis]XP_021372738.1 sodium-dependent multivitamin transporter-like isoform X2 [Mizuhopecten yessoensis]XP_021372739.1 sodiu
MAFLKWEDYVIFIITLVLSLGIGLFYSIRDSKKKTTRYFLLGDGNMAIFPVALSMLVSIESGIMMLSIPAEVYMYGMQWYISIISVFVTSMLTMHLIIPTQRKLNITSLIQYFELRYNSHGLRLFSTIIRLLAYTNYLGNVVFIPAVTLEVVAGIPVWISIVTLMGVVVVYTIIGGFKAVVWTDVFQAFFMFGGMFAVLIKGTMEAGGIAKTCAIISEKGRINLLNFDPDPTLRQSFWSLAVGGIATGFEIQFSQMAFQRIKATPTLSTTKRMFILASILSLFISGLAVMEGAVMFAYYHAKGCDPLEANQVTNQNQLMAKMVRDIFQDIPCLPGLFLASLFSASLSTMSSLLSVLSTIFWEDIVKRHTKSMSEKRAVMITQSSIFLFGGLAVIFAFCISGVEGPVSRILDITGSFLSGTLIGLFILGWFVPRSNALGALVGGMVSCLFVGWISFGKLLSSGTRASVKLEPASTEFCPVQNISSLTNNTTSYHHVSTTTIWKSTDLTLESNQTSNYPYGPQGLDVLYSLSYKWLLPIAIILVVSVGTVFSHLQAQTHVDPSLTVPVCDYLARCIPAPIRKLFRCGVKISGSVNDIAGEEMAEASMVSTQEDLNIKL